MSCTMKTWAGWRRSGIDWLSLGVDLKSRLRLYCKNMTFTNEFDIAISLASACQDYKVVNAVIRSHQLKYISFHTAVSPKRLISFGWPLTG